MNFSEWITYVFDHPVTEPAWHWDIDSQYWDGPGDVIVEYMTRTFEESGTLLSAFSDEQVRDGLNFLVNGSYSNYPDLIREEGVPLQARLRCIDAMGIVFRDCFAKRCSQHLSHLDEPGTNPLNSVCYMWWDILPVHGISYHNPDRADGPEMDKHVLQVIKNGLTLDSVACVESSILGYLEWNSYYPQEINKTVNDYLKSRIGMRKELRAFALRWFPKY